MQRQVGRPRPWLTPWLVLAVLTWPALAQVQEWSAESDPVLGAMNSAIRERRYADAEKIVADAVSSAERTAPNPQLGYYLGALTGLYERKGDSSGALRLAQRALENDRSLFGPTDVRLAPRLSMVAQSLQNLKRTREAEQHFRHGAEIALHAPNPKDLGSEIRSISLANLASFYSSEGRYGEAVQWYEDAVKLCGNAAMCTTWQEGLAGVYRRQGRLADAERLTLGPIPSELTNLDRRAQESMVSRLYVQAEINYRAAIAWIEQNPSDLSQGSLAMELVGLGQALEAQGRNAPAEEAYKRAIEVQEARVNPRRPPTAYGFTGGPLARLYRREGRFKEAEAVIQHWLGIQEKILGPEHANVAETLMQLAQLYEDEAKSDAARYSAAASVYERVLKIQEKSFGPDARQLTTALARYADVLRKLQQDAKAAEVQARVDRIRRVIGR